MFKFQTPTPLAMVMLLTGLALIFGFKGCELTYDHSQLKTKEKGSWKLQPVFDGRWSK